jgi:hypothetical protein
MPLRNTVGITSVAFQVNAAADAASFDFCVTGFGVSSSTPDACPPVCSPPYITFFGPGQTCTAEWQPDATGMQAELSFQSTNSSIVTVEGSPVTLPEGYTGPWPAAPEYQGTFVAGSTSGTAQVKVLATHPDGTSQYYSTWTVDNAF